MPVVENEEEISGYTPASGEVNSNLIF
jgi:hypothetical protein